MKTKKTLCLLMALLLSGSMLAACSSGETSEVTDAADAAADAAEVTTAEITLFEADDLPDDLDFGGATVNVFVPDYSNAYAEDIISEEETGNRLTDSIYNVNKSVEERLNVDMKFSSESFTWSEMQSFSTKLMTSIMAGDNAIEIVYGNGNYTTQMLEGEYFVNLAETKYVNLEKPWYNQTVRDNILGDYIHFVSGRFAIANVKNVFAIYFNSDLYTDLGNTDDLYTLVDDGVWTIDKLEELTKGAYADLNGDGTADPSDRYGMTFGDHNKYLGFLKAFNIMMFEKQGDEFVFTYDSERAMSAIERMTAYVNSNPDVLPGKTNNDQSPDHQISTGGGNYASRLFMEGRSVFTCGLVADAATIIPSIEFGYGILPYPKWDETQEEYFNTHQRGCYQLITSTAADIDCASATLEALASESYRTLIPEYCEVTLKTRYSQDDDVSRMFDLIGASVLYDPGELYSGLLGTPSAQFKNNIVANNPNWASTVEGMKESLVTKMAQLYE